MAGNGTKDVAVAPLSEFADGDYRVFSIDGVEVGVFRLGDKVVAYENVCPHAGGPVCQGQIFHKVEEALTPDKRSAGLRFSDLFAWLSSSLSNVSRSRVNAPVALQPPGWAQI